MSNDNQEHSVCACACECQHCEFCSQKEISTDHSADNSRQIMHTTDAIPEETEALIHDTFYTPAAHRMRRIYHITIFTLCPILYLLLIDPLSNAINIDASKILSIIIILSILFEFIRIKKRFIIFGMREYERDHICAQTWGTVSACIVLMLSFPRIYSIGKINDFNIIKQNNNSNFLNELACNGQIAIPIIWTLGFGDPLLGELKKSAKMNKISWNICYFIAWIVILCIWIICWLWCDTPWWLSIFMPPIAIIAEKPSIPHIDDNGLMLLVPLLVSLLLEPWYSVNCNPIFYQ